MRTIASLLLTLITAVVIGVVMALMDKFQFYLVLIVPLIGGAIIGAAANQPSGERTPRLMLAVIGIFGALLAQGIYWGGQYLTFRENTVGEIIAEYPDVTREEVFTVIDEMGGFRGFVEMYAEEGMSITRMGSSSTGIELQGGVLYAFWVAEALIMAGAAVYTALNKNEEAAETADAAPATAS